MAFIGVLLLSLIFLVLFLAVVCGIIFLIGLGLVSLIGGIILTVTGTAVTAKSKKKMLGIILIVVAALVLVPSSFLVFKILSLLL